MRNAFARVMTELADADKRIVLLSGDIGNKLFDNYKEKAADRFFNCGVAEANMIGLAAGLGMSGLKPIAYTITPFITYRAMEQIRVDVCYHNVPVIIAGVGSGLCYASLGATHHSCEDIAMLRTLPHMTVLCPGDAYELESLLKQAFTVPGPVYLRLGKKGEPLVHQAPPKLTIGKALPIRSGTDICILSTGNMLPTALATAKALDEKGLSAQVTSFHTVKPLDTEYLRDAFSSFSLVASLEEHSILGGFGAAVAEWLSDQSSPKARLLRFGTPDDFLHEAGSQEYAHEKFGLKSDQLIGRILSCYEKELLL